MTGTRTFTKLGPDPISECYGHDPEPDLEAKP